MPKYLTTWQAFAIASAFFAGLTVILGKVGVERINSNLATFVRTVVILALVALILTFRREWRWQQQLPTRDIAFLIMSGITTGLSWLCYYRALQLGPASHVAPVDKLSVAFAILLATLFLGEELTWQVAVGGAFVVAGAVIMTL